MKTTLIFILLFTGSLSHLTTSAQTENKHSVFHFSFIPPLSTHGPLAVEYSNQVSVNLLTGISENEEAFTLGGLANIIHNNANGLQFAGLVNYVGNNGQGTLFSGLANLTVNHYKGLQFSGLMNTAKHMRGVQFSGLGNITQTLKGFQFGGLGNISGNTTGFQFGGLGNISKNIEGFQFGGLFNIARQVKGVQFAGLINIAESCDYPIALLNFIRNGEYALGITCNEMGCTILTLRSGGRVTYGILGIGYNYKTKGSGFTTEGGLGIHLNITKWLRINHELKGGTYNNSSERPTFYTNYALLPAFRLSQNFEIFGGPSLNYLQSNNTDNTKIFPNYSFWKKFGESRLQQLHIGFQAGAQYIF